MSPVMLDTREEHHKVPQLETTRLPRREENTEFESRQFGGCLMVEQKIHVTTTNRTNHSQCSIVSAQNDQWASVDCGVWDTDLPCHSNNQVFVFPNNNCCRQSGDPRGFLSYRDCDVNRLPKTPQAESSRCVCNALRLSSGDLIGQQKGM